MKLSKILLSGVFAFGALHTTAWADTTSSASSAASNVVGSVSDSIQSSSKSSSGEDKKTAQGDYRLIEVAAVDGRPEMARLQLQNAEGEFALLVPRSVQEGAGLQAGDTVAVAERAYGLQFSVKGQAEPFFLAVHDKLAKGLNSKVVRL
jgi:hypothetical protein